MEIQKMSKIHTPPTRKTKKASSLIAALIMLLIMLLAAPLAIAQYNTYDFEGKTAEVTEASELEVDAGVVITAGVVLAPGLLVGFADSSQQTDPPEGWQPVDGTSNSDGRNTYNLVPVRLGTFTVDSLEPFTAISQDVKTFETFVAAAVVTTDSTGVFNLDEISFVGKYGGSDDLGYAMGFLYSDLTGTTAFGGVINGSTISVLGVSNNTETTDAFGVAFSSLDGGLLDIDGAVIELGDITVLSIPEDSSAGTGGRAVGFVAGSAENSEIILGDVTVFGYGQAGGVLFGMPDPTPTKVNDGVTLDIGSISVTVAGVDEHSRAVGFFVNGVLEAETTIVAITANALDLGDAIGFMTMGGISGEVIIEGSIEATAEKGHAFGLFAIDGSSGEITVEGNVRAETTDGDATGLRFGDGLSGSDVASLIVQGTITAISEEGAAFGVHVVNGGITSGTFGEIYAESGKTDSAGMNPNTPTVAAIWTTGDSTFTLKGDVTAIGAVDGSDDEEVNAYGILVSGGSAEITIDGDITIMAVGADDAEEKTELAVAVYEGDLKFILEEGNNLTIEGGVLVAGGSGLQIGQDGGGIMGSTIKIDLIGTGNDSDETYGFLVNGDVIDSTIEIGGIIAGDIDDFPGVGAAGFAVCGETADSNITIEGIIAGGSWAVGAHFDGDVTGEGTLEIDYILVNSKANEAHGLKVDGNLDVATTVGTIVVESESVLNAFGIRTETINNLTLKGNITVIGTGNETSGIRAAGIANITLAEDVTIDTTHAGTPTNWVGADIWTDGNLSINLNGNELTTSKIKVDDGGNLTITGGGTAELGALTMNGLGGVFTVGAGTAVTVATGSTFGSQTAVAGTLNTAGGTINRLTGGGDVTANENLTIGGGTSLATDNFTGTVLVTGANNLTLAGGRYSGNLTAATTTVNAGATLAPIAAGMTVTGNLVMNAGSTLQVGMLNEDDAAVEVDGNATIHAINVDLVGWASFDEDAEYILIDSDNLTYNTTTPAIILVNGEDISGNQRLANAISVAQGTGSADGSLLLSIEEIESYDLVWKEGNGAWGITGGNWEDGETFVNNDNVTFGVADEGDDSTYTITVVAGGVNVGMMEVTGNNNWTFTSGNITGTNVLLKDGEGTLVFENNVDFTAGGIMLAEGTIQFEGTVHGDIATATGTSIVFAYNGTLNFNYNITGNGVTTIADGVFLLGDGKKIAGNVIVANGATLGGIGTIGGLVTIESGGIISPGMSPGSMGVGSLHFKAGSIYEFEHGDSLVVATDGSVRIESGAILRLVGTEPGTGGTVRIIATDSETQFDATDREFDVQKTWSTDIDNLGVGTRGGLAGYWISWSTTEANFADKVRDFATPNAYNVAVAMDEIGSGALYDILSGMPAGDHQALADAFAMLHGEVFATSKEAAVRQQRNFQRLMPTGRELSLDNPRTWNRWGTFTGGWQGREKIDQYSAYDLGAMGVALGIDRTITPNFLFGAGFGYDYADQNFKTIESSAQIEAFRAMIYGSWYNGEFYVDAYGGYTKNFYKTKRNVDFTKFEGGTLKETLKGSYDDDMGSVGLEVGRIWQMEGYALAPSIGLHYIRLSSPSVTETLDGNGDGITNLFVEKGDYESLRLPIGVKASRVFIGSHNIAWTPEVRAFYTAELADDSVRVRTAFDSNRNVIFDAESGKWGRHSGRLGLGLGALVAHRLNVRLDYDFEMYNHTNVHVFMGAVGFQW